MSNPNPSTTNLRPFKKGQSGNPAGKARGTLDLTTRVRRILNRKIDWDKLSFKQIDSLKERYGRVSVAEAIIWVQVSKALTGDTVAFNALRKAGWGDTVRLDSEELPEVVHIYKPEKLKLAQIESVAQQLRERAERQLMEEQAVRSPIDLYASKD